MKNVVRPIGRTRSRIARTLLVAGLLMVGARAARAQDAEKVYEPAELTTPPKLSNVQEAIRLVQRSYPEALRTRGVNGTVELEIIIGANGKVQVGSVTVVDASIAAFGDAAKTVAEKLEFVPAKVNGKAVKSKVVLPLVYQTR
jgi:protein TonB